MKKNLLSPTNTELEELEKLAKKNVRNDYSTYLCSNFRSACK